MEAPVPRPALLTALRGIPGSVDERIDAALAVLVEDVGMELALVSEFQDGWRVITHARAASTSASGTLTADVVGRRDATSETICHLLASGAIGALTPDAAADPILAGHPHRISFGLGAYAGVPLRSGDAVVGVVCCASTDAHRSLGDRDVATLQTVSAFVSEVLVPGAHSLPIPRPPQQVTERAPDGLDMDALAGVVAATDSLPSLSRALLEILQQLTHLESTYVTTIDWAGGTQRVDFASNVGELQITAGMEGDWSDALCRRSLETGVQYTADVPSIWGDSAAARALGLMTYVSVPVRDQSDGVIGTLCGASRQKVALDERDLAAMSMFARLLGAEVARDAAHQAEVLRASALEDRTRELTAFAARDALTGVSNRSAIHAWLDVVLLELDPAVEQLAVAFVDVDRFKDVNDTYGHAVGDRLLQLLACSLGEAGRAQDLVGRLGGDEFVVAAVLPASPATYGGWQSRLRRAATLAVDGISVTASVGTVTTTDLALTSEDVLALADEAMYAVKRASPAAVA